MRCEQARRMLAETASRDLDAREAQALEKHRSRCAACSNLGKELEQTWGALAHHPSIEISADFRPRLREKLRAEDAGHRSFWHRHSVWRWQWAALAACAALIAVILTKTAPWEDHSPGARDGITQATDRDHRDELFMQDLEQTLKDSASDYLATYDSWPGGTQGPRGHEPVKAGAPGRPGKKEPS
jgi:anti-sigma-K factor RskA